MDNDLKQDADKLLDTAEKKIKEVKEELLSKKELLKKEAQEAKEDAKDIGARFKKLLEDIIEGIKEIF